MRPASSDSDELSGAGLPETSEMSEGNVEQQAKEKRVNSRAAVLIALHVLLFFYSFSGFTSKFAAQQPTMSFGFFAWYGAMLGVLAIYALGWQQILKRLPLTVAFANKAITVVWGIVWGVLLFGETVTPPMVIGGAIVIAGVVLFALADGEERRDEAARNAAEPAEAGDRR